MKIVWQPRATRQLKKITTRQVKAEIITRVEELTRFPEVAAVKALKNHQCTHRLRVGDFRVLFNVFEAVDIVSIEEVKKRNERTYR